MDLRTKTDDELDQWIVNHEGKEGGTSRPLYRQLLEERARRAQVTQKLSLEKSLAHLKATARTRICTTYGDLAAASGVEWSQARHQMNGSGGHLERLLDLCHARELPLLTAICVNQSGVTTGDLGEDALAGFVAGARRLGFLITDGREFHHRCRDECWEWGSRFAEAAG
jgi:hypothetical protein